MTLSEINQLLMQHADEYCTHVYQEIDGEMKRCKKLEVTVDLILRFCQDYNLPVPEEWLNKEE